MAAVERVSFCAVCDVVVTWRLWRDWDRHLNSQAHRECVIAPRAISPDRIRPIDPEGRHFGLAHDPVAMSYHVSRPEHRELDDPWAQPPPSAPAEPQAKSKEAPEVVAPAEERFAVRMEPLLISVADASRVLGLSTSTISSLAAAGTIPSLRIGKRVLLPVKALEEWIEGRLAEDADRYHAAWSGIRAYAAAIPAQKKRRGYPGRRSW